MWKMIKIYFLFVLGPFLLVYVYFVFSPYWKTILISLVFLMFFNITFLIYKDCSNTEPKEIARDELDLWLDELNNPIIEKRNPKEPLMRINISWTSNKTGETVDLLDIDVTQKDLNKE